MAIRVLAIGDSSYSFFKEAESEYLKRLTRYAKVEYIVLKSAKGGKNYPSEKIAEQEGRELLKRIKKNDLVVLLDEKGKQFSSEKFAVQLEKWMVSQGDMVFVIGGAYGFSKEMYASCHALLSLSSMTFSHQMVRMFFFEQLYRAFTILNGEPYHNS